MSQKKFKLKWFLLPLSLLYGIVVAIRNKLFDLGILNSQEFSTPIIAVGNITVGGTGKTPHVEYLISLLKDKYKVAVLSRGYKRKTKGFVLATDTSTAIDIGDEPLQIKLKFPEIDVAVNNKRVKGIYNLLKQKKDKKPNVILLDDAFQHRYVKPSQSILLIDFNRLIYKDYLLPVGRLRESTHQIKRSNIIIVTKIPDSIKPIDLRIISKELDLFPYQALYFTHIKYDELQPLSQTNEQALNLNILEKKEYSILLLTGIANPASIVNYLEQYTNDFHQIQFPDHHTFTKKDMEKVNNKFNAIENNLKIIITTEKDAVKLKDCNDDVMNPIKQSTYYLPIKIEFINNGQKDFDNQMLDSVEKKKNCLMTSRKSEVL